MAENNNASRLYVVKETTPGTIKAPSAGSECLALQPGFEFNPNVDTQQNEELRAGIGPAKPITGLEKPTASFSHYLRGSASEGNKGDFDLLLESLFGSKSLFYSEIEVTAANKFLDFTDDDGTVSASIALGVYENPQLFAAAVTTAMNAANGAKVALCVYSFLTGKFTITSTGTVLSLLLKTGAHGSDNLNTSATALLGYTAATNKTGVAAGTGYASDVAVNGIERKTTGTASTAAVVNLAAGGGADFARGQAVLVKNTVYEIRPVDSVATDALTLGFNLLNAPNVANIFMGQCLSYIPVNSGHPVLSMWLYRANGADIEAIQGALVTQMDVNVDVGNLINLSFQAGGTKFFFDPIEITASNKFLDVTDGAGTISVSVAPGIYRDPQALATALAAALNAGSADDFTVVYTSHGTNAGKFTITSTGSTLSILFKTGTHGSDNLDTHIGTKMGFSDAANLTGALTYTSTSVQVWSDLLTPALDDSDPLVAKGMEMLIGDASDYISPCVQTMKGTISLDTSDVKCIKAVSGIDSKVVKKRNSTFEITAVLEKHEASLFDRFINNTVTKFCFNFGPKDGADNWIPGRCGCIYAPAATISGFRVSESDGTCVYIFTVSPYMDNSGNPEIYMNLL